MKQHLEQLIQTAIQHLQEQQQLPQDLVVTPLIEATRDKQHGDFACNIALILAKIAQRKPRELAELLMAALPASSKVLKVEIAGPGFINFFMAKNAFYDVVAEIHTAKGKFGHSEHGQGKRVIIEVVSANPTGPLHVGHGRHAAYGAAVADLLEAVGYNVHREYYVNDGGRQMDILAVSVWLRYLQLCGEEFNFPANAYRGDYVADIAQELLQQHAKKFYVSAEMVMQDLPLDEPEGGDKELYIDAVIVRARALLQEDYELIFNASLQNILNDIRADLAEFGVHYQKWFSEREFVSGDALDRNMKILQDAGYLYESEGAIWFRSTDFGDEKDRVLMRSNGQRTYFAADFAYHIDKFDRGFDLAIDIFGSDHHGYVPRMRAALQARHIDVKRLTFLLVQFVVLYRSGERVQMSTRSGSFVTLRELREEVGNDAARFFYVMRKCEQHMDFDLDLAKSKSNENPVYYIQYAHARIASVMRQLPEKNLVYDAKQGLDHLSLLTQEHEQDLLKVLTNYPEVLLAAAMQHEPHILCIYLRDVANAFHTYYNSHQFIVEDTALRNARLALIIAAQQVIANGLKLIGVSAPETM